ncbi:MAG: tetratricopeptide repeat protein, partial [Candidatus Sericytochromatia bacterium]
MILRTWQLIALGVVVSGGLYLAWPRDPELAEVQLRAGALDEGLRLLERVRRAAPQDEALRRRLGRAYEQAGRLGPAVGLLEEEAAKRPLTAEERARARRLALAIGDPARALALLTRPNQPAPTTELAALVDLALQAGDLATAIRLQRRLADERPGVATLARLRDLALGAGDPAGAVAAQRRLIGIAPTRAHRERLVELWVSAGDNAEALAAFEALGPAPGAEAAHHRRAAQLAEWAGLGARAVPHWRALYALEPELALGRKLLAALVAAKDPGALAFAGQLAAEHPTDAALRRDYAGLLLAAGRVDEA